MSKRGARASLMAYVSAEEHLLDCYSPLTAGGDMEVMAGPSGRPDASAGVVVSEELVEDCSPAPPPQEPPKHGSELDPAVDSMLHVISDDSDIHSLISSDFKGWEEQHPSTSYISDGEPLIYGLRRSMISKTEMETEAAPHWSSCTPAKHPCRSQDVIEINDSPESIRDPSISMMHSAVLLTNGNAGEQFTVEEDEYEPTGERVDPCMIYETVDGENMVVLAEEHCCEIIVATQGVANEQEFARAILMAGNGSTGALLGLLPEERHADELNGGDYIEAEMVEEDLGDDEARVSAGNNVYLSDAALEQPLVHQDLVEDEENENATFVDDTPMEEERPDICQVYDDELEDHDRDEENEVCIMQHTAPAESAEAEQEKQVTPLQQLVSKKLPREHSSPTEFPVSSSSMPNASYNYDYEDDLMATHTPFKRKYPPLMKNTLYAEAMDRRLASICQAQPQMSPAEKVSSWETAFSNECAAVEDVESFQADFEKHEATAAPLKQHSFVEFREMLVRNLEKISRDIMQVSDESTQEQASSQSAERPVHRRLLHVMPTEETIVLDDDDEDDCYEVMDMDKASVDTLVPEEELMQADRAPEGEEVLVPIDACEQRLVTKEATATAPTAALSAPSLERMAPISCAQTPCCTPASVPIPERSSDMVDSASRDIEAPASADRQLSSVVLDVMRQQVQMQQQFMDHKLHQQQQQPHQHMYRYQELPEPPPSKHSVDLPSEIAGGDQEPRYMNNCPTMFYEQQEFCNYLGLTELATANAVATAMRELANSTVARRSLRVRPQHQLDRMRSDVRGKRRGREQPQDKDKKPPAVNSSSSSCDNSDKEDNALPEGARSVPGADVELIFDCPLPAMSAEKEQLQKGYYYADIRDPLPDQERVQSIKEGHRSPYQRKRRSPGRQEAHRQRSPKKSEAPMEPMEVGGEQEEKRALSVEAAFAKIYDAAAPAQSKLLQSMQQRLRQARETKPSIYIIKATHNEPAQLTQSPKQLSPDQRIDGAVKTGIPRLSPVSTTPVKASPAKASPAKGAPPPVTQTRIPKASKLRKAETDTKRRRTTVAATTVSPKQVRIRDLVTRSTTHLNSKLLRNRKVSLLKSYALSDEMAQGRGKRLSAGINTNTNTNGAKKGPPPKIVRGTVLKRPKDLGDKKSPEQYRLQEQQLVPPNTPRQLVKGDKPMPTVQTIARKSPVLRVAKRVKRSRAKSLPAAFAEVSGHDTVPTHISSALMDVPPKLDASVTHLQPHATTPVPEPYAKSFLIYPPSPTTPPSNCKVEERPRRQCQQAGSGDRIAGLDVRNIDSTPPGGLLRLSEGSCALSNPLSKKYGKVLYMYYELDQLIVLQETCITFWKYSKVLSVLHLPKMATSPVRKSPPLQSSHHEREQEMDVRPRWVYLGRLRRITNDTEIFTPYGSRICVHNSTPVYLEMQSRSLDHHKREVKLTSLHVNVYYFCEEDLRPRMHSVHLDSVNCEGSHVIYTSIADSRYFVMAWQQELVMGRPRSGICKYSLTPTLDTLASIREFKQLRHELRHIECLSEDRLIGYGQTRVTVWDHRSGDTLMNYDLGRPLGRSLAAMHYPSLDLDQSSMLILFQYLKEPGDSAAEVHVIACELSHATPSHRLLQIHRLPSTQFDDAIEAVNTGDHLIIKSSTDGEAWINAADPRQLTYVAPLTNGAQRFYSRHKSQVIEMSAQSLTVDSITNHMLKLAVQQQYQYQVPV